MRPATGQYSFYRLFGDVKGSGFVTNPNYNQFKLAYGVYFDFGPQVQRRLRLRRQRVHHQQPELQPVQIALRDTLERAVSRD